VVCFVVGRVFVVCERDFVYMCNAESSEPSEIVRGLFYSGVLFARCGLFRIRGGACCELLC